MHFANDPLESRRGGSETATRLRSVSEYGSAKRAANWRRMSEERIGRDVQKGIRQTRRQRPCLARGCQIQDLVAGRAADLGQSIREAEHAQGQILDREFPVTIGSVHPALASGIVGFIDHAYWSGS